MLSGKNNAPVLEDFQLELLRLIGEELSSEEIAARMCKSIHTISAWRQHLLAKCKVKTRPGKVCREAWDHKAVN